MAFHETVAWLGIQTPYDEQIASAMGSVDRIALVKGIIATESEWNPNAINPNDPSAGLMQMLPTTAAIYRPGTTLHDLLDPVLAIDLGTRFVNDLLARYSESDAVASYNAGSPRKNAAGQYVNSKGDPMVQAYVDSVLTYQTWYLNHMLAAPPTAAETTTSNDMLPTGGSFAPAETSSGSILVDALLIAIISVPALMIILRTFWTP